MSLHRRTWTFAAVLAAAVVATPVSAQAATRTVYMGLPTRQDAKAFEKANSDVNNFFPQGVTIHVVGAGRTIPSTKAVAKLVRSQVAADLVTAKKLASTKPPAGTVSIGASGPKGVEYYGFFPNNLTIDKGTTLHFTMSSATR